MPRGFSAAIPASLSPISYNCKIGSSHLRLDLFYSCLEQNIFYLPKLQWCRTYCTSTHSNEMCVVEIQFFSCSLLTQENMSLCSLKVFKLCSTTIEMLASVDDSPFAYSAHLSLVTWGPPARLSRSRRHRIVEYFEKSHLPLVLISTSYSSILGLSKRRYASNLYTNTFRCTRIYNCIIHAAMISRVALQDNILRCKHLIWNMGSLASHFYYNIASSAKAYIWTSESEQQIWKSSYSFRPPI